MEIELGVDEPIGTTTTAVGWNRSRVLVATAFTIVVGLIVLVFILRSRSGSQANYSLRTTTGASGIYHVAASPFAGYTDPGAGTGLPYSAAIDSFTPRSDLSDVQPLAWLGVSMDDATHGAVIYTPDGRSCGLPASVDLAETAASLTITLQAGISPTPSPAHVLQICPDVVAVPFVLDQPVGARQVVDGANNAVAFPAEP